jgi:hypothetical protein
MEYDTQAHFLILLIILREWCPYEGTACTLLTTERKTLIIDAIA